MLRPIDLHGIVNCAGKARLDHSASPETQASTGQAQLNQNPFFIRKNWRPPSSRCGFLSVIRFIFLS